MHLTDELVRSENAPWAIPKGCRIATLSEVVSALKEGTFMRASERLPFRVWVGQIGLTSKGPQATQENGDFESITEDEFAEFPDNCRSRHVPGENRVMLSRVWDDHAPSWRGSVRVWEFNAAADMSQTHAFVAYIRPEEPPSQIKHVLRAEETEEDLVLVGFG